MHVYLKLTLPHSPELYWLKQSLLFLLPDSLYPPHCAYNALLSYQACCVSVDQLQSFLSKLSKCFESILNWRKTSQIQIEKFLFLESALPAEKKTKVNNQLTINLLDRKQPEKRQKYFASGLYVIPLPTPPTKQTNSTTKQSVSSLPKSFFGCLCKFRC